MTALLSLMLSSVGAFFTKLLFSLATESFLSWAFFYLGDKLVKSTANTWDDETLVEIKKSYDKSLIK